MRELLLLALLTSAVNAQTVLKVRPQEQVLGIEGLALAGPRYAPAITLGGTFLVLTAPRRQS